MFDLGEGLLDRIEVGRVWRQVPEPGTGGVDHSAKRYRFVAAEIVQDDDVARSEHWNELLFDIGSKALAVDRAIEDAGGGQAIVAQRPEERQRPPAALWCEAAQALALRPPATKRCHIGLDPGLVEEDQMLGIEARLP